MRGEEERNQCPVLGRVNDFFDAISEGSNGTFVLSQMDSFFSCVS